MEKWMTPNAAAALLAVSPTTVREWLRTGTLRGAKVGTKIWRISETELGRFLDTRKREPNGK